LNYLVIGLFLYLLWLLLVIFFDKRGTLSKHNITVVWILIMPILMIRTTKGQIFLDRLSVHKKFWRVFASIGLPAMLAGMLAMFILILLLDYFMIMSFQTNTVPPVSKFNEPRNIFLIPGINEYIPLWYGIIALIITLIVHEFSHAILCKVESIKVKSMGVLLAIVPIGGFAEPDEEQLLGKTEEIKDAETTAESKKFATRSERVRVLTAGVMANFVTALIAFILFFSLLGSISPVGDVMVTKVIPGYPADLAGVKPNMILTGIDDVQITGAHDFLSYANTLKPGEIVTLNLVDNGVRKKMDLVAVAGNQTQAGVKISNVIEGSPAEAAGIRSDMVLVKIGSTEIKDLNDFVSFMNSTSPGQKVNIYLMSNDSVNASLLTFSNVELIERPEENLKMGYLGVHYTSLDSGTIFSLGITIGQFPARNYLTFITSIPSSLTSLNGWIQLLGLPFFMFELVGFPGFSGVITSFYEPTGWAVALGSGMFVILNILLWIGWMNFYVGLFNCLPAVPLDGGHVFRDVMASTLSRIMGNGEKVERLSNAVAFMFAVLILMSFVFVIFAPYAAQGF